MAKPLSALLFVVAWLWLAQLPATAQDGAPEVQPADIPPEAESSAPPSVPGNFPVTARYDYNGAYGGGGGFLHFETLDKLFTLNIQNQLTADGTFYNLDDPNTYENGFNIPFYRGYVFGNLFENWEYLASVQQSLGSFNILDMYGGYLVNDTFNLRAGHFLSPFLYEYYAFSPGLEPVITNSPLFQLAGKRQTGLMAWGRLFEKKAQYQFGLFNGVDGGYFDIDRFLDLMGSLTLTPFVDDEDSAFRYLGAGLSFQTGAQRYLLSDGTIYNFPFGNGEPTLNQSFVNSTGLPFFLYQENVEADGMRSKVAPHVFWYGRGSLLAEYVYWNRALTNGKNSANELIHGVNLTASWILTGESYVGDGLGGYHTIDPISPWNPGKGRHGIGAWELAAQYSSLQIGSSVVNAGFATPSLDATRLDQIMVGINWWPTRAVRWSLDYVYDMTNKPVDVGGGQIRDNYSIFWTRLGMFF